MQEMASVANVTPLGIGGPTSSAWREETLTRAAELGALADWISAHPEHGHSSASMTAAIDKHLKAARATAEGKDAKRFQRFRQGLKGSSFERTLGNLDAVEVDLLRLAPAPVLKGALPSIQAHVNRFLPKDDPRRQAVDEVVAAGRSGPLGADQRDVLVGAQHAANSQRRRALLRLRGFRSLLVGGIVLFIGLGLGLAILGQKDPSAIPLCFVPEDGGRAKVVCPRAEMPIGRIPPDYDGDAAIMATVTPTDLWLVEGVGLLAAALAAGAALRKLKGSSTPYGVPVLLAVLKLPTGAVTAVVGLMLMRAEFVPGLSALDSSAQILGWAVVFGISQQLVTRFADSQAEGLLEKVGGRGAAGDRPEAPR